MDKILTSLTYRFPEQNDPRIQELLSAKKEFANLELPRNVERIAMRGDLFLHQKMSVLFFHRYNYLLVYKETGVGKTGEGWANGEEMRLSSSLSPAMAYLTGKCNYIKKFVILTPGDVVESAWTSTYEKHSTLAKIPTDFYMLAHYIKFYITYSNNNVSDLKQRFDNSFFWMDEIQDFLVRSKQNEQDRQIYEWYGWFFSVLSNIKLAFASATPLVMTAAELSYIVNLIPRDIKPMPVPQRVIDGESFNEFYSSKTSKVLENKLKPYLTGVISHLKNKQKTATVVWPKESTPLMIDGKYSGINTVSCPMQKPQLKIYEESIKKHDVAHNTALQNALCACDPRDAITPAIIKDYACKIAKLADIIKRPGVIFIVSRWVKQGTEMIVKYLEALGFGPLGGKGQPVFPKVKGNRYMLIASGNSNTKNVKIINDPRNVDGEYIKIVITSDVGTTAISLNHVLTYIPMDPSPHLSDEEQRKGRIFRPESYTEYIRKYNKPAEVMVYYLVADPGPDVYNVDIEMHTQNISKDKVLDEIRNIMQRVAYDAQLTYQRNQLNCPKDEKCIYGYSGKEVVLGSDTSTYYLNHYRDVVGDILKEFIAAILLELSIDVDEFWQRKERKVDSLPFYRTLARLVINGGRINTNLGDIVYIKRIKNVLFVQNDINRVTNSSAPSTSIYALTHATLEKEGPTVKLVKEIGVVNLNTLAALEAYLNTPCTNEDKTFIYNKIKVIQNILVNKEPADMYTYIRKRYMGKYLFEIGKPIQAITILSLATDVNNRIKIAENMRNTEIAQEGPLTLVHIFGAQRNEITGTAYNIFTDYLKAKKIAVYDETRGDFVQLDSDSAESLAYSAIISKVTSSNLQDFMNKMEDEYEDKGWIWGAKFDPEMAFRIYNKVSIIVDPTTTKVGDANKIKAPRTKKYKSYSNSDYWAFLAFLGIGDHAYTPEEEESIINEFLSGSYPSSGIEWLKALERVVNDYNVKVLTENKITKTLTILSNTWSDYMKEYESGTMGKQLFILFILNTEISNINPQITTPHHEILEAYMVKTGRLKVF